ncbi:pilus assembly protein TadG-related protein [Euzebya sp.]|uniref:pilus assembly protein TadG-related protein n=1 Tax=Euzebya sp. TaxID=1971409 RepID=UPI0035167408
MRRLRGGVDGERGSVIPSFLVLTLVTVVMGVFFFQTGRATDLGAEAQTGSDAASLAAAADIRQQILEWIYSGAWNYSPFVVNVLRARGAAQMYAARNDVTIEDFSITTVGYLTYDVHVQSATRRGLTAEGYVDDDPEGGTGEFTVGDGEVGRQEATARVGPGAASFLAEGYWSTGSGGFGPGSGGSATTSAGTCATSRAEVLDLAQRAGVSPPPEGTSFLERYSACDGAYGRVAVRPLAEEMKISLLKLEAAMGEPLQINSAYRSPQAQAIVCAQVTGPCAAPGRSMHQSGLAVDVQNYQRAAAVANADPSIGLCQPLPRNDAVHLSHRTGRECGGNTGTAGGGAGGGGFMPFGGFASLSAQAGITVRLVE